MDFYYLEELKQAAQKPNLGITDDDWTISSYVENLADKAYWETGSEHWGYSVTPKQMGQYFEQNPKADLGQMLEKWSIDSPAQAHAKSLAATLAAAEASGADFEIHPRTMRSVPADMGPYRLGVSDEKQKLFTKGELDYESRLIEPYKVKEGYIPIYRALTGVEAEKAERLYHEGKLKGQTAADITDWDPSRGDYYWSLDPTYSLAFTSKEMNPDDIGGRVMLFGQIPEKVYQEKYIPFEETALRVASREFNQLRTDADRAKFRTLHHQMMTDFYDAAPGGEYAGHELEYFTRERFPEAHGVRGGTLFVHPKVGQQISIHVHEGLEEIEIIGLEHGANIDAEIEGLGQAVEKISGRETFGGGDTTMHDLEHISETLADYGASHALFDPSGLDETGLPLRRTWGGGQEIDPAGDFEGVSPEHWIIGRGNVMDDRVLDEMQAAYLAANDYDYYEPDMDMEYEMQYESWIDEGGDPSEFEFDDYVDTSNQPHFLDPWW